MKKSELRQLIREEIQNVLNEEKHGIIPNLDRYTQLRDPDYDLSSEEFEEMERIEKEAEANGTLSALVRAADMQHFGRDNRASGIDYLKNREQDIARNDRRITKAGKLSKPSASTLKKDILSKQQFDKLKKDLEIEKAEYEKELARLMGKK